MPTPYPTITAFDGLTAPSRYDPATLAARSEAWFPAFGTMQLQQNAAGVWMNTTAAQVAADAATATAKAAEASAHANAAAAGATAPKWAAGNYADGAMAWSPLNYRSYRKRGAGASATDPANDSAGWEPATTGSFEDSATVTQVGALTLTANSSRIQRLALAAGVVALPDATTIANYVRLFVIENVHASAPLAVRDNAGALLCVIPCGSAGQFICTDASTAAGAWRVDCPDDMCMLVSSRAAIATLSSASSDGATTVVQLAADKALAAWVDRQPTPPVLYAAVVNRNGSALSLGPVKQVASIGTSYDPCLGVVGANLVAVGYPESGGVQPASLRILSIDAATDVITASGAYGVPGATAYDAAGSILRMDNGTCLFAWGGGSSYAAGFTMAGAVPTFGTPVARAGTGARAQMTAIPGTSNAAVFSSDGLQVITTNGTNTISISAEQVHNDRRPLAVFPGGAGKLTTVAGRLVNDTTAYDSARTYEFSGAAWVNPTLARPLDGAAILPHTTATYSQSSAVVAGLALTIRRAYRESTSTAAVAIRAGRIVNGTYTSYGRPRLPDAYAAMHAQAGAGFVMCPLGGAFGLLISQRPGTAFIDASIIEVVK